jgi:hypothetical protein
LTTAIRDGTYPAQQGWHGAEKRLKEFTPYRKEYTGYRKKKMLGVLVVGLLVLTAAVLGIVSYQRSRARQKMLAPVPDSRNIAPQKIPTAEKPAGQNVIAEKPVDGQTQVALVMAANEKQGEGKGENDTLPSQNSSGPDGQLQAGEKQGSEKSTGWIDLFNKCRYSFAIHYQQQGGVDIFVIDTYTGKMQIKTNYIENGPLTLFSADNQSGERRFFHMRTAYQTTGTDVYVLDNFSSEIETAVVDSGAHAIQFFKAPKKERTSYYSAQVIYNSGKIDYFVFDDCSSEMRMLRGLDKPEAACLFNDPQKKMKSRPHFFSMVEMNSGYLDFYTMDMVNGEVRTCEKIGDKKQLMLFAEVSLDDPPRYGGWVDYTSGMIEFWAVDGFNGELRLIKGVENLKNFKAFDNPLDKTAWFRFDVLAHWDDRIWWLYTFDSATGEFISDSRESLQKAYRYFPGVQYQIPQNRRYNFSLILRIGGGVDLYVLDTYTSEIRVARSISEKKSLSLF